MSYPKEREEFIHEMTKEGLPLGIILKVLRHANTIQRLAAVQCSGGYPYEDGATPAAAFRACARCEALTRKPALVRDLCPSCRAEDNIRRALLPHSVTPDFSGDPRGACVKLKLPSGRTNDWGRMGWCVPTGNY